MERRLRRGQILRCANCSATFRLDGPTFALVGDEFTQLALPLVCPHCGANERHFLAFDARGGKLRSDRADRIQSTMRWDAENHKFLDDLSHESGLSIADLVNEFVRFFQTNKAMTDEVVGWLRDAGEK